MTPESAPQQPHDEEWIYDDPIRHVGPLPGSFLPQNGNVVQEIVEKRPRPLTAASVAIEHADAA